MVMESAVTFSTTPVVIPHCVSHPALGGKTLQSQVAVFGGSVGPEVVTGVACLAVLERGLRGIR